MSTSVELNDHGPFFAAGYRSAWRLPPSSGSDRSPRLPLRKASSGKKLARPSCARRLSSIRPDPGDWKGGSRPAELSVWSRCGTSSEELVTNEMPVHGVPDLAHRSAACSANVQVTRKLSHRSLPKTACGCETRLADDHAAAGIGHCREAVQAKGAIASPSIPERTSPISLPAEVSVCPAAAGGHPR